MQTPRLQYAGSHVTQVQARRERYPGTMGDAVRRVSVLIGIQQINAFNSLNLLLHSPASAILLRIHGFKADHKTTSTFQGTGLGKLGR